METKLNTSVNFSPGQIVFLKSNPSTRGAIVEIIPGTPEDSVRVFVNNSVQTFFASQLQIEVQVEEDSSRISCDEFHAYLTALQIRSPALSTLYSLNAARIDYIPYQYRPVLKFIKSDRPRLLIADSVGVGKTIEAGLILRELQARGDLRSVLIICPRPLVAEEKWQREMKRFDEDFMHLDGKTLRYCIKEMHLDGEWPEQYQKVILPYSLLDKTLLFGQGGSRKQRTRKGLLDLDPPPHFDLVIADEAHHIRNQNTANHDAVRFFCEHANAAVFLTATPIQLHSHDLFVLLNVLRPDLILDQESFEHMSEPNPFINSAIDAARAQEKGWEQDAKKALDQAATTPWGQAILNKNPEFIRIRSHLAEGRVTPEERIQHITDMETLHTFSGIINRTRRRDIGEFTIRRPQTVPVPLTPKQEEIHEALLETKAEIFRSLHGDKSVNFMMTTLRRQLASCLYGLEPLLEDILTRHLDELEWTEADAIDAMPSSELVTQVQEQIQTLLKKVKDLEAADLKLEQLRKIVRDRQNLPNNRIMVFSSFRHTLAYLYKHLKADGIRVGMIHGGVPDEERRELSKRFEKSSADNDSLDIMLFSEVGCEGLDYQFCDCIVNYDLPWNPMKIEQRIGRIDRKGQKSESVTIYNMITPDTVDADIYDRCLSRIGVFESALGGSEEILGKITTELQNIAEDYELTQEQRIDKLKQLEDNEIRLLQEHENLEAQQLELFSIPLSNHGIEKEVDEATSFWLTPASIQRLVTQYLQQKIGTEQEFILGEKSLKTLRLSQEARNVLLRDFQQFRRERTSVYREWENWLKGTEQHLPITFEADCATQNPDAVFIMPIHPLVKQASKTFRTDQKISPTLKVKSSKVPADRYEFAIYQWRYLGMKENLVLMSITSSDVLMPHLSSLLENAEDNDLSGEVNLTEKEAMEKTHHLLWSDAREKHRERIQAILEYRRENLSASHEKRIALLEEKIEQVPDPNIQRMRHQQIAKAETDYNGRIQELENGKAKADITAELVAYGILEVV
ncbi:DEAD/DEAH box helicase [Candidatus Poribacteria bacterium]|nr:DEAD/DEAH box helicase [Candidatus Poribacteria bacterium]MYB66607.1 DEAD/DEAH box helicase [Candidatus Poribacteria bacterium]